MFLDLRQGVMSLEHGLEICEKVRHQVAHAAHEVLVYESGRCDYEPFTFRLDPKWRSVVSTILCHLVFSVVSSLVFSLLLLFSYSFVLSIHPRFGAYLLIRDFPRTAQAVPCVCR